VDEKYPFLSAKFKSGKVGSKLLCGPVGMSVAYTEEKRRLQRNSCAISAKEST
jgi:hypothetical protein